MGCDIHLAIEYTAFTTNALEERGLKTRLVFAFDN